MIAPTEIAPTTETRLLTADEMGAVLGIDRRSIQRMARCGQIPRFAINSRVHRFDRRAVLAALEKDAVTDTN